MLLAIFSYYLFLAALPARVFVNARVVGEPKRTNYGLIGFGIRMYEPLCAFACRAVLASNRLSCSESSPGGTSAAIRHRAAEEFESSVDCFASNDAFLLSLAFCMQHRCNDTEAWKLSRFWSEDAVGDLTGQPDPKYTYFGAIRALRGTSDSDVAVVRMGGSLDVAPSEAHEEDWTAALISVQSMAYTERYHSLYCMILILATVGVPCIVGVLRRLSLLRSRQGRFATWAYSALFGGRHAVALPYDVGILPTRGQLLYIVYLITLNAWLMLTGYGPTTPNISHQSSLQRFMSFFANRIGHLAFANYTLLILSSSRHNILGTTAKWTYATSLLYHRWIAYICVLQGILHSSVYLAKHIDVLPHKFSQAYWNWGTSTVTLMCFVVILSALPVRKRVYEVFLDSHILFAGWIFVGSYYHIIMKFRYEWGYENWILLAAALWTLERLLRLVKLIKHGLQWASISHIDEDYLRVDITNVRATGCAFLYFPTASWRFWQNHPFSIASSLPVPGLEGCRSLDIAKNANLRTCTISNVVMRTDSCESLLSSVDGSKERQTSEQETQAGPCTTMQEEKNQTVLVSPNSRTPEEAPLYGLWKSESETKAALQHSQQSAGLTFYVRRQKGFTARLFDTNVTRLRVLVEGPYHELPMESLVTRPSLLCIAGGVGISTILPWLLLHALVGRTVLFWSCRSRRFVEDIDLSGLEKAGILVHVRIRKRWNVEEIVLEEAAATLSDGDLTVLVSGPNELADVTRKAVCDANRLESRKTQRRMIRFVEDSFHW